MLSGNTYFMRYQSIQNLSGIETYNFCCHDDVIKWKHFPRYWPFVKGIHRSPVNSPHKDQWRGALTFSLICAWTNGWANHRDAGDLTRHHTNYDVAVICYVNASLDVMRVFCVVITWFKSKNRKRLFVVARHDTPYTGSAMSILGYRNHLDGG